MVGDPIAALNDVTVTYPTPQGPVTALANIDLEFARGTSTAIVGRSGSGKSTLVSVLALLRKPSSGRVTVNGTSVSTLSDKHISTLRSAEIGIVFQAYHLEASLTAIENVMLPWFFAPKTPRGAARERARQILDMLDIGDLADRRPNEMSGGQRQRVAIGRGLFPSPTLFIADEPTGNLDEETADQVARIIFSLPERFDTTVVMVSHDHAVADMADRRLHLVQGQLT